MQIMLSLGVLTVDANITVISPFPGMQAVAQAVVEERMEEWPQGKNCVRRRYSLGSLP